jgi:hypothetical protein
MFKRLLISAPVRGRPASRREQDSPFAGLRVTPVGMNEKRLVADMLDLNESAMARCGLSPVIEISVPGAAA